MTDVAYLLLTFVACMAGLGAGLLLHFLWGRAHSLLSAPQDPFSSISEGETASWDAFTQWQAENNRRFASQVAFCGAAPFVIACVGWGERSDVVKSVCGAFTQAMGQAYICM
jgi:hypothetical protein